VKNYPQTSAVTVVVANLRKQFQSYLRQKEYHSWFSVNVNEVGREGSS